MNTGYFIDLEEKYGARNYRPLDVVLTRGQGNLGMDVEGKQYMDCLSSYSAVNQGHCHPKIIETMIHQAAKLTLTSRAFRNDQLGPFYEELCALTNSICASHEQRRGSRRNGHQGRSEMGVQNQGDRGRKAEVIVCENNFHGRTITIVGFSTEPQYRNGFSPFTPGFVIVPFGDIRALEAAITKNSVAFLVEPIQGEAGVIIPPPGYLAGVVSSAPGTISS